MAYTNPILERNRELANRINEEALRNPHSPYANKVVGLINGQVVVVDDDLDEVVRPSSASRTRSSQMLRRRSEPRLSPGGIHLGAALMPRLVWPLQIACFGFLNRFTYGNFGDPSQFGLEC